MEVAGLMVPVVALIVRPVVELNVPAVAPMARVGVTVLPVPAQARIVAKLNVATGAAVMVTVVPPVTAAQPPEAATVLVTKYVPKVEVEGVMVPLAAMVRPVVGFTVMVPSVLPVPTPRATVPVVVVQ